MAKIAAISSSSPSKSRIQTLQAYSCRLMRSRASLVADISTNPCAAAKLAVRFTTASRTMQTVMTPQGNPAWNSSLTGIHAKTVVRCLLPIPLIQHSTGFESPAAELKVEPIQHHDICHRRYNHIAANSDAALNRFSAAVINSASTAMIPLWSPYQAMRWWV